MNRSIHFERMRETSKIVIPLIKDAYLKLGSHNNHLLDSLNYFVSKRTNDDQCLLRPYLVRLGYELAGKSDWVNIASACAAIEILNISTYQSNIVFDSKNGGFSHTQKNNQFISSMLSLELAIDMVLKLEKSSGSDVVTCIIDRFHETNRDIYIGQFIDLNEFAIDNLDLTISESAYLTTYIQRCNKLGGSLTSLCLDIGCLLGEGSDCLRSSLKDIGMALGTAGQILNDLSDYIPQIKDKDIFVGYKSSFSDFRMGKITYPLFHLLNQLPKQQYSYIIDMLLKEKKNTLSMEGITHLLCQYGSVKATKKLIWRYYKLLKKEIKKITRDNYRDFLSITLSSLLTNKYFAFFREIRINEHARKTQ
jgi:geranylgeranyl pyrophosphate synthase